MPARRLSTAVVDVGVGAAGEDGVAGAAVEEGLLAGAVGLIASVWFLLRITRSPKPLQNPAASAQSPARGGRHRARNATVATALLGMLLIAGHPVTDGSGTYAHFSDQQSVQFQIAGEGATPSR